MNFIQVSKAPRGDKTRYIYSMKHGCIPHQVHASKWESKGAMGECGENDGEIHLDVPNTIATAIMNPVL